ncbi:Arylsulfatase J [Hypsibius exemplaris]|uniref:Arylsulfatase J n=1 Tax=Hypsibius exemplaris TaxID=2072580 RepID=A0A1W0W9E6_HYPEX|nr:Arylsulfatase J [Hypsibius exemplaris]
MKAILCALLWLPLFLLQSKVGCTLTANDEKSETSTRRPNIVFILADDLGHADVGYSEGSHQTPTPNIDKLAWTGVILNRHYVNPLCTPTRSALLTGKYSFHTGIQNAIIPGEPWGVPLNLKLLPQHLKDLNYSTFMLGKWHVGCHTRQYLPGARGFDYWFGFPEGFSGMFHYTAGWPGTNRTGRQLYENGVQVPAECTNNNYFPELMLDKFEQIVHNAERDRPFYVHFATPLPRANMEWDGATEKGVQHTMPQYSARPAVVAVSDEFPDRKRQLAQIQALDEQVRRITNALQNKGLLDNTIIVFAGDNGGSARIAGGNPWGINHASNWPLRQAKSTLFDGGIRTLAYVWSPIFKRPGGIVTDQLFSNTDWLPTLYEAAGGDPQALGGIDGVSHWQSLVSGSRQGPRQELPYLLNHAGTQRVLLYKEPTSGVLYKLLGTAFPSNTGWERTEGTTAANPMTTPTLVSIRCNHQEGVEQTPCQPWLADCLFDLTNDPCETDNIAASHPEMVQLLTAKLAIHNATNVPSLHRNYDPNSNPARFDGWLTPWMDPEPVRKPASCAPFNPSTAF